jgi:carbon monoxide dehydrogenase subunit G
MVRQVNAPVSAVWSVLMDPAYAPKLYPDVISVEQGAKGPNVVGHTFHTFMKAGKRKLEIFAETTEIVTEKKVVVSGRPGGLFESFERVVLLEPRGDRTEVRVSFKFEFSMSYLGKVLNMVVLERLVMDNLKLYAKNLKEISELLPFPE